MRRRGFTLLEVMIAMTVLVLAIAAILPLFAVGTASHKRAMDQTAVRLIASQVAARVQEGLVADAKRPPRDVHDAEILFQGRTYRYDVDFEPLDAADLTRSTFIARVTIKWNDASRTLSESFDTVLLGKAPENGR